MKENKELERDDLAINREIIHGQTLEESCSDFCSAGAAVSEGNGKSMGAEMEPGAGAGTP